MATSDMPPISALPSLIVALRLTVRLRRRLRKAYDKLSNQIFVLEHPDYFLKKGHGTRDTQTGDALTTEQQAECEKQRLENLPIIDVLSEAQQPITKRLDYFDKEVQRLAKQLPVYAWVKETGGIAALGLGLIVGEAGDLSKYENPAKLWKRFGLAVMPDGRAQGRVRGAANGFSPIRRAILHTIGAAMVKLKGCAYREIYLKRKAYEMAETPTLTKMHAHRRAMRYMEKRFLRDLWEAWQQTRPCLSPKHQVCALDETSTDMSPNKKVFASDEP